LVFDLEDVMSRGLKIALILVAITLFCCCVAGLGTALLGTRLVGRAFITNPERVQAVGSQIADYDVPPGYQEMFAMNMMGIKMVAMDPSSPTSAFVMIMLMQFPPGMEVSRGEMERQIEQALARQTGLGSAEMTSVGQEEATIKGEPVTLTVREGVTDRGEHLRQVTGLFEGKGGPVVLMISGDVTAWDQEMMDEFIASIR
jgi:hypothetical protein